MNQVEYAAHCGCSKQYVNKLVRSGVITLTAEKKIDRDKADSALAAIADPSKSAVIKSNAERYGKPLVNPAVQRSLAIDAGEREVLANLPKVEPAPPERSPQSGSSTKSFADAKYDRERALADQARFDYDVMRGKYVLRDVAARMAFEAGRSWRNQLTEVQNTLPTGIVAIVKEKMPNADADAVLAIGHAVTQAIIGAHRGALENVAEQLKVLAQSLDSESN